MKKLLPQATSFGDRKGLLSKHFLPEERSEQCLLQIDPILTESLKKPVEAPPDSVS
jgi:hypothetical protein